MKLKGFHSEICARNFSPDYRKESDCSGPAFLLSSARAPDFRATLQILNRALMLNFIDLVFCFCCFILREMIPGEGSGPSHPGVLRGIQGAEKRERVLPESHPGEPKSGIFSLQMQHASAFFLIPWHPVRLPRFGSNPFAARQFPKRGNCAREKTKLDREGTGRIHLTNLLPLSGDRNHPYGNPDQKSPSRATRQSVSAGSSPLLRLELA